MISVKVTVSDTATPFLSRVVAQLKDRSSIHAFIAGAAERDTRDYIVALAPSRHASAQRLGANPTGYFGDVAASVRSESASSGATVALTGAGFARAFKDATIKPGAGKKYLTIPAHRDAYGKRAGEFGKALFFVRRGGSTWLARTGGGDGKISEVIYVLVREARQRQDRTLLPSDAAYAASAETGAEEWIDAQAAYYGEEAKD